jgi:hypothetical protein
VYIIARGTDRPMQDGPVHQERQARRSASCSSAQTSSMPKP